MSCNKLACLIETIIKNPNAYIGSVHALKKLIPKEKNLKHGISELKSDNDNTSYYTGCNAFRNIENHVSKLNEFRLISYNTNVNTINVTRNENRHNFVLKDSEIQNNFFFMSFEYSSSSSSSSSL